MSSSAQIGVTGLQNPADFFVEGDELDMEVTEVDPENRRIVLNVTRVPKVEAGHTIQPRPAAPAAEGADGAAPEGATAAAPAEESPAAEVPATVPESAEAEAPAGTEEA